ncbi:hypothetical protein Plhal304r1_c008g0031331 [Plasmopara halstedii]
MANMDEKSDWLLDSGSSSHMSSERKNFHTYKGLKESIGVTIADGGSLHAIGMGDIHLQCTQGRIVKIVDALHISGLDRRLLSVANLTQKGLTVSFGMKECTIFRGEPLIATVPQTNNLYRVKNEAQTVCVIDRQERTDNRVRTRMMKLMHTVTFRIEAVGHTAFTHSCMKVAATNRLTFFSNVLFHASSKSFSTIKGEMALKQWLHSNLFFVSSKLRCLDL